MGQFNSKSPILIATSSTSPIQSHVPIKSPESTLKPTFYPICDKCGMQTDPKNGDMLWNDSIRHSCYVKEMRITKQQPINNSISKELIHYFNNSKIDNINDIKNIIYKYLINYDPKNELHIKFKRRFLDKAELNLKLLQLNYIGNQWFACTNVSNKQFNGYSSLNTCKWNIKMDLLGSVYKYEMEHCDCDSGWPCYIIRKYQNAMWYLNKKDLVIFGTETYTSYDMGEEPHWSQHSNCWKSISLHDCVESKLLIQ
eukprot:151558_1